MKKDMFARNGALILIVMLFGWLSWMYRSQEQLTIHVHAEDMQSWIDDIRIPPGVHIIQE